MKTESSIQTMLFMK